MLMLLVLRVLGLLLIPALIGQIKQLARNGMHTEDERKEKELIKTLADESGKTTESIKAMLEEKEKAYELTIKELESVKELANSNSEIAEKLKQQQKEREDIEALV